MALAGQWVETLVPVATEKIITFYHYSDTIAHFNISEQTIPYHQGPSNCSSPSS